LTIDVTTCYAYFAIKGAFPTSEVSRLLGVSPTKQWDIGDKRKNGSLYKFALWEVGYTKIQYPDIEMRCMDVIRELIGKENLLMQLKEAYDVSFVLEVVPSIENGKVPIIEFGSEVIKFCYLTETEIDLDMYVYPFNERE
jgi:hypothetical protein